MNKIILSLLTICALVAGVTGTAYALFSSTFEVSGITIATGNALLEASTNGTEYDSGSASIGLNIAGMFPTEKKSETFYLMNSSESDINLNIKARLTAAGTNWEALKNIVFLKVDSGANTTDWKTLAQWNAGEINLPGGSLGQSDEREYEATLWLHDSADNDVANKKLTNVTFLVTGTQAN